MSLCFAGLYAQASGTHLFQLASVDYIVLVVYFAFVLGVGALVKRFVKTGDEFLTSGRSVPAWICGLAFVSANLGAQEVIGMGASGAKYGIMTCHFYWLGAIPAMVFVAIFMMPFYYGSKARSVPEYLKLRFDEKTRAFNAFSFAVMTIFSSGISMYALALMLEKLLNWNFHLSIALSAAIVLVYTFLGGLTAAIYNEVLQFFLIVFGFLPLSLLGLKRVGGWSGMVAKFSTLATARGLPAHAFTSSGQGLGSPHTNPMGVEWFSLVMGLGFVLSFAYWCTDFLLIQRALAADSMRAARRTPLIAAVPKMLFPFLVIVPGMVAMALTASHNSSYAAKPAAPIAIASASDALPVDPTATAKPATTSNEFTIPPVLDKNGQPRTDASGNVQLDYNLATPAMLAHFCPAGLLGLGLTALMASFMSGMAGNVTAFNTVWTYDIYQGLIRPGQSDAHYLTVGRVTTVVGILLSAAAAYAASQFDNIMDFLQLIFSFVNAPLLATFLLGMFWKRATGHGAFIGLVAGTLAAVIHQGLTVVANEPAGFKSGWFDHSGLIVYSSEMAQNFWTAICAFGGCFIVTIIVSLMTPPITDVNKLRGLVYSMTPRLAKEHSAWYSSPSFLGFVIILAMTGLMIAFW